MVRTLICCGCLFALVATTPAAMPSGTVTRAETLEVGKPLARFSKLKPGTHIYLRYKIVGEQRETVDLWRRQVSFEEHDGQRQLHILWRWDSVGDRKFSRSEEFWFDPDTFRPLTVVRRLSKEGKVTVSGFRYQPDRVVGMAELPDNEQKDFLQLSKMASYNWETDMELLQTLPLQRGYQARIPFYEAGPERDEPQYYDYKVLGDDKIVSTDGQTIDCWVIGIESNDPKWGPTRFWFAKDTQILIRERTQLKDGTIFVKMLLPYDDGRQDSPSGG